jgi:predicted metal-dependent hydrolase
MPKFSLAITIAIEHFTAILAHQVYSAPELFIEPAHEDFKPMFQWHAAEEIEHKAVAYDVYNAVGGGYFTRILGMIVGSIALFGTVFVGHLRLMWEDGALFNFKDNAKGIWFAFGWRGVVHDLVGKLFDYFRPGFHPLDHDTVELLEEWREKMFNEDGILADQIKNPRRTAAA